MSDDYYDRKREDYWYYRNKEIDREYELRDLERANQRDRDALENSRINGVLKGLEPGGSSSTYKKPSQDLASKFEESKKLSREAAEFLLILLESRRSRLVGEIEACPGLAESWRTAWSLELKGISINSFSGWIMLHRLARDIEVVRDQTISRSLTYPLTAKRQRLVDRLSSILNEVRSIRQDIPDILISAL